MIIRLEDIPEIKGRNNAPLLMKPIITREQHSKDISVTWIKNWGPHGWVVCHVSDRPYYILEGEGEFQLGDGEPFKVKAGDSVYIPRGVPYTLDGQMTYLVMNGPAFLLGSDERPE